MEESFSITQDRTYNYCEHILKLNLANLLENNLLNLNSTNIPK